MIGQIVRHGRTKKDAKNLHGHLMKGAGTRFEVLNSAAPDLQETMNDMIIARDGSRAESAFLHISLSPSRDMTDDELRKTAEIVMKHFNADEHQAVLVIHEKDRANDNGNRHAHLVLGRVGPDGDVLLSGFDKIKLETAVRIAEFELGEPSVLGRHHKSAIKWLQANGRDDVAQYMIAAHSNNPEKPTSSASPAVRQKIERTTGKDLNSISSDVRDAWEKSDNGQSFAAALTNTGLTVKAGKKDGVFVIMDNGQEIGALDRLLKEKRANVKSKMGEYQNGNTIQSVNETIDRSGHIQRSTGEPSRHQAVVSAVEPARASRAAGQRPNRTDSTIIRSNPSRAATSHVDDRRHGKKTRCYEQKKSLITLDRVRLSSESVLAGQSLLNHKSRKNINQFEINQAGYQLDNHKKGWRWVEEFRNDLIEKIREIQQRYFSRHSTPDLTLVQKEPDVEREYSGMRFG